MLLSKRNALLVIPIFALALVVGLVLVRPDAPVSEPSRTESSATVPVVAQDAAPDPQSAPLSVPVEATHAPDTAGATETASDQEVEQDDGQIGFKADAGGHIVLDENTRLDLEKLHALFTSAEREKKLQELSATLSPAAERELYQLVDQYQNYQAAAYQAYPPGRELTSAEEVVEQIDGMHGLRVQFFGEQATEKMFGAEEKAQRELYKFMANEKDPSLTVEEKAARAQQLFLEQQGR